MTDILVVYSFGLLQTELLKEVMHMSSCGHKHSRLLGFPLGEGLLGYWAAISLVSVDTDKLIAKVAV